MNDDTRKTMIRHYKGIVAALEKEESHYQLTLREVDEAHESRFEKEINDILDKKWNNGHEHRMTLRPQFGRQTLDIETKSLLDKIAVNRNITVSIERYIVTFSK